MFVEISFLQLLLAIEETEDIIESLGYLGIFLSRTITIHTKQVQLLPSEVSLFLCVLIHQHKAKVAM